MKVEFQEADASEFMQTERGIAGAPKLYHVKDDGWYLRCYACGEIYSINGHAAAGMIHVENGVVDIRGASSHSIKSEHRKLPTDEMCLTHFHIYNGEIVVA